MECPAGALARGQSWRRRHAEFAVDRRADAGAPGVSGHVPERVPHDAYSIAQSVASGHQSMSGVRGRVSAVRTGSNRGGGGASVTALARSAAHATGDRFHRGAGQDACGPERTPDAATGHRIASVAHLRRCIDVAPAARCFPRRCAASVAYPARALSAQRRSAPAIPV
eukprot:ctg_786.g163